jgi:phage tail-like protein
MATGERTDPYRSFNFQLEIDGVPLGAFSECSGLSAEGDAVDYREGTDMSPSVRKLVGLRSFSNISLKRGYTADKSLWTWFNNIVNGIPDRRDVTIVLMDEQRMPVLRWYAENAWVNKIEAPSFNASGNEVAMESVELVHEGVTIDMEG